MDLKELATWLHDMQELTGGCVLEMRADGRAGGLALELSWRQDGQAMGYAHHLSGVELRQMYVSVQSQVLEQIRKNVARRKPPNRWS